MATTTNYECNSRIESENLQHHMNPRNRSSYMYEDKHERILEKGVRNYKEISKRSRCATDLPEHPYFPLASSGSSQSSNASTADNSSCPSSSDEEGMKNLRGNQQLRKRRPHSISEMKDIPIMRGTIDLPKTQSSYLSKPKKVQFHGEGKFNGRNMTHERNHSYETKAAQLKGLECMKKVDYMGAVKEFTKVIDMNPQDLKSYIYRAKAYMELSSFDLAILDLNIVISSTPGDADLFLLRAQAFSKLNNHDSALKDYSQVIEIDPNCIEAYKYQTKLYLQQGNEDFARINHNERLRLDDRSVDIENLLDRAKMSMKLADLIQQQQEKDSNLQAIEEGLPIKDTNNSLGQTTFIGLTTTTKECQNVISFHLAVHYVRLAIQDYSNVIDLDSMHMKQSYLYRTYLLRGDAFQKLNEHEEAIQDYSQALCYEDNTSVRLILAKLKNVVGKREEAISEFKRIIASKRSCWEAFLLRGEAYIEQGDYDSAIDDFSSIVEEDIAMEAADVDEEEKVSFYERALYNRARIYMKVQKYVEAIKDYDTLQSKYPMNQDASKERLLAQQAEDASKKALADEACSWLMEKELERELKEKQSKTKKPKKRKKKMHERMRMSEPELSLLQQEQADVVVEGVSQEFVKTKIIPNHPHDVTTEIRSTRDEACECVWTDDPDELRESISFSLETKEELRGVQDQQDVKQDDENAEQKEEDTEIYADNDSKLVLIDEKYLKKRKKQLEKLRNDIQEACKNRDVVQLKNTLDRVERKQMQDSLQEEFANAQMFLNQLLFDLEISNNEEQEMKEKGGNISKSNNSRSNSSKSNNSKSNSSKSNSSSSTKLSSVEKETSSFISEKQEVVRDIPDVPKEISSVDVIDVIDVVDGVDGVDGVDVVEKETLSTDEELMQSELMESNHHSLRSPPSKRLGQPKELLFLEENAENTTHPLSSSTEATAVAVGDSSQGMLPVDEEEEPLNSQMVGRLYQQIRALKRSNKLIVEEKNAEIIALQQQLQKEMNSCTHPHPHPHPHSHSHPTSHSHSHPTSHSHSHPTSHSHPRPHPRPHSHSHSHPTSHSQHVVSSNSSQDVAFHEKKEEKSHPFLISLSTPLALQSPALQRIDHLLGWLTPTRESEHQRNMVYLFISSLVKKVLHFPLVPTGSYPLKTYLPDGDMDVCMLMPAHVAQETSWFLRITEALCAASICEGGWRNEGVVSEPCYIRNVTFINAEVKVVKCTVNNISVDITASQVNAVKVLYLLEEVNRRIAKNHLFKRSLILIKAWCQLESTTYSGSSILGASVGALSTYSLNIMVVSLFNRYWKGIYHPLHALAIFLDMYAKYDWKHFCVSIYGDVDLRTMKLVSVYPDSLIELEFLELLKSLDIPTVVLNAPNPPSSSSSTPSSSSSSHGSSSSSHGTAASVGSQGSVVFTKSSSPPIPQADDIPRVFPIYHCNVMDPLNQFNNVARSVTAKSLVDMKHAMFGGRNRFYGLLSAPLDHYENAKDLLAHLDVGQLDHFFGNCWANYGRGDGWRPDLLVHPRQQWHGLNNTSYTMKSSKTPPVFDFLQSNLPTMQVIVE